jgi:hypothetical protein
MQKIHIKNTKKDIYFVVIVVDPKLGYKLLLLHFYIRSSEW